MNLPETNDYMSYSSEDCSKMSASYFLCYLLTSEAVIDSIAVALEPFRE